MHLFRYTFKRRPDGGCSALQAPPDADFGMKYDIVAIDLDNTLLTADTRILPESRDAIREAAARGVHIVIATGRGYGGLTQFQDALGICDYTISVAGGIVSAPGGRMIHGEFLPPQTDIRPLR